jgi:hypothetical protein
MQMREGKLILLNKDGLCLDVRLVQLDERNRGRYSGKDEDLEQNQ